MHSPSSSLWFRTICRKNNVHITDEQLATLERFVSLLLRANRAVNLISRKDEENVWESHILHSISPAFRLNFDALTTILDLGTGGGLPGIPLKILFPSTKVTLLDSVRKKTDAVEKIVKELGLSSITTVCARAEDLIKKVEYRAKFDAVVCRAVAPLKKLVQWSLPMLKTSREEMIISTQEKIRIPSGTLIAFKGGNIERELIETRQSKNVRSIHEIPLVFHGSETVSLVDKKLILLQF